MVHPSLMVVRQCRSKKRGFVVFDIFRGRPGTGAQDQGIMYRLIRAEGWSFGVESIRRGSEPELRRLPILVALGVLQSRLQWIQRVQSLLVAGIVLASTPHC